MVPASSFQVVEVACQSCGHLTFYRGDLGVASPQITALLKMPCRRCARRGVSVQLKYSLPPGTTEVLDLPEV